MPQNPSKISAYIGFARRSGAIIYGVDNFKKSARLILVSKLLGPSSLKRAARLGVEMVSLDGDEMKELFGEGVKAVAITNGDLAKAILKELENREETN